MSESPTQQTPSSLGEDVVGILILLAVLGMAVMLLSGTASQTQVPVVQAAQDIPALTVIKETDVMTGAMPSLQAIGIVNDMEKAVGLVTTQAVKRGTALKRSDLLKLPRDPSLVSVPISGTLPPAVGDTVTLYGVRSGADITSLTIEDAVVVMVEDEVALVAVTLDQAKSAAPYLATSKRLVLVRRSR